MAKGKKTKKDKGGDGTKPIASYKRAYRDYEILDTYEAGMVLTGSEVKSLREGNAQIAEGYARVQRGELWLDGIHIPPYTNAIGFGAHDPDRVRKLLMNRAEIDKLDAAHRAGRPDDRAAAALLEGGTGEDRARAGQGPHEG